MQQTLNFDLSEQPIPVLLRGDKWDSVWSELTDNEDLNFVDASTWSKRELMSWHTSWLLVKQRITTGTVEWQSHNSGSYRKRL